MYRLLLQSCMSLLTGILLTACASNTMSYDDYLYRFHDMSEKELVAVWGKPARIVDMGTPSETEQYFIYSRSAEVNRMVSPAIYQPYFDGKTTQQRIVQPERWQRVTETCETTFILQKGIVAGAYHTGDGCITPKDVQEMPMRNNPDIENSPLQ